MAIFRGTGGAGDATTDAYASEVAQNAATATTKAAEAASSASSAANSATSATSSAASASTSATSAAASATTATNEATDAAASATSASSDAATATTQATNAATSAANALTSEQAASASQTAASTSASEAEASNLSAQASATNANNSASAASASATAASASELNARNSEVNALASENSASTDAASASTSAANAATSATAAATSQGHAATSESNAAVSATAANTSAVEAESARDDAETANTNALASEVAAQTSATTATDKAAEAAISATSAGSSAGAAAISEANAYTSESNAATSAGLSGTSAAAAATSEANAADSEAAAATSATNASNSESGAATSATNAATSAGEAATSASLAAGSAGNAATSETNAANSAAAAANSATSASTSATSAANILDEFDDIYLGTKATDPTLDNDGDALAQGSLYFNSTDSEMKVYTGSAWVTAYVSLGDALLGGNNLSDVDSAETSRDNLGLGTTDAVEFLSVALSGSESDEGVISWDSVSKTANMTMGNGVNQQIGEELYYPKRTRNMTGTTIPNGTPVMLVGGVGEDSYIAPAIADGSIPHEYYAGLTTETIADGDYGRVLFFGSINDIDTSAYTKGQLLYVSDTTYGAFTTTSPEAPSHSILAAIVTKVGTTDGRLFVRVHTNPEAGEITFDNSATDLISSSVQGALEELDTNKASIDLLSSNITLFPTTATSPDVTGHNRLVIGKDDSDYDTTAVDVATGFIGTTETLVGQLASDDNLIEGSIAGITVTLLGNIEKLTGNANQGSHFYFKIFRRESNGTEHLMGESFHTEVIYETSGYEQFSSSVYLADTGLSTFALTDRIVLRFYGISDNTATSYQFQFGGAAPVRTILPVPISVVPKSSAAQTPTVTTNFGGILSGSDTNVQAALDTLDDHVHAIADVTGLTAALNDKVSLTGYNKTNWDTAFGWGNHASVGYLTAVPSEFLTQTEGDGRYLQSVPAEFLTETEGDTRYVNVVGNTLTGRLMFDQQVVTANTSSTVVDFSTANDFIINMSANTAFSFSNLAAGQTGVFYLKQDATGGRTFSLPSQAKTPQGGATIVQQTGGSSISVLSYTVLDTSTVLVNYVGDYA